MRRKNISSITLQNLGTRVWSSTTKCPLLGQNSNVNKFSSERRFLTIFEAEARACQNSSSYVMLAPADMASAVTATLLHRHDHETMQTSKAKGHIPRLGSHGLCPDVICPHKLRERITESYCWAELTKFWSRKANRATAFLQSSP